MIAARSQTFKLAWPLFKGNRLAILYLFPPINISVILIQWRFQLFLLSFILCVYTLRPRQNGRHFPDGFFKCIFLNENIWISMKISLKFLINNIPSLVQIMAWRRPGDKPLSKPMMVSLPTHICVIIDAHIRHSASISKLAYLTRYSVNGDNLQTGK